MFRNYFKTAIRNLWKGKGFAIINISGLAVGMASAGLILLWVQNELRYDRFYPKIVACIQHGRDLCWKNYVLACHAQNNGALFEEDFPE